MHATHEQLETSLQVPGANGTPRMAIFLSGRRWNAVLDPDVGEGATMQLGDACVACFRVAAVEGDDARQSFRNAANFIREHAIEYAIVLCSGKFGPGAAAGLFVVEDHVNWMGDNPLIGMRPGTSGERFIDLAGAYDPALRSILIEAASDSGLPVEQGVGIEGRMGEQSGSGIFASDAQLSGLAMPVIAARQAGARVVAVALREPPNGAFDGTLGGEKGYRIADLRRFIQKFISSALALSGV